VTHRRTTWIITTAGLHTDQKLKIKYDYSYTPEATRYYHEHIYERKQRCNTTTAAAAATTTTITTTTHTCSSVVVVVDVSRSLPLVVLPPCYYQLQLRPLTTLRPQTHGTAMRNSTAELQRAKNKQESRSSLTTQLTYNGSL